MKLADYLTDQGHGAASRLARDINAFASDVSNWANGSRPVPPVHCPAIETATGGQVMRWDLRPDDWYRIWPELKDRPDAPEAPKAPEPETAKA